MNQLSLRLAVLGLLASSGFAQDTWPFDPIQYFESTSGVASAPIPDTGGIWPNSMPATYLSQTFELPAGAAAFYGIEFAGLDHTWVGDLQIVLISPSGTGYNILHRPGFPASGAGASADLAGRYAFMNVGATLPTAVASIPDSTATGEAYEFSFGNWPNGTNGIYNETELPPEAGTWELRVYDWEVFDDGSVTTPKLEGRLFAHFKVDFGGTGQTPPPPTFAGANGFAGNWTALNESAGPLPIASAVVAPNNCTLLGASATFARPGLPVSPFGYDNPNTTGPAELLLDDGLDLGGVGNFHNIVVSGLPIGDYSLFVHAWAPDEPILFEVWVSVPGGIRETALVGGGDWTGNFTSFTTHSNFVSVTDGTLEFGVTTSSGFGTLNGFELRQVSLGTSGAAVTNCPSGGSLNGCFPNLVFGGSTSFSANEGFLFAVVDGSRSGGFFYGLGVLDGAPFGTGTAKFCVTAPRVRLGGIQNSGGTAGACNGVFQFDMDQWWNSNPTGLGLPLSVGQSLYFQAWLRDAGNGSSNIATSNGLRLTFQP